MRRSGIPGDTLMLVDRDDEGIGRYVPADDCLISGSLQEFELLQSALASAASTMDLASNSYVAEANQLAQHAIEVGNTHQPKYARHPNAISVRFPYYAAYILSDLLRIARIGAEIDAEFTLGDNNLAAPEFAVLASELGAGNEYVPTFDWL